MSAVYSTALQAVAFSKFRAVMIDYISTVLISSDQLWHVCNIYPSDLFSPTSNCNQDHSRINRSKPISPLIFTLPDGEESSTQALHLWRFQIYDDIRWCWCRSSDESLLHTRTLDDMAWTLIVREFSVQCPVLLYEFGNNEDHIPNTTLTTARRERYGQQQVATLVRTWTLPPSRPLCPS